MGGRRGPGSSKEGLEGTLAPIKNDLPSPWHTIHLLSKWTCFNLNPIRILCPKEGGRKKGIFSVRERMERGGSGGKKHTREALGHWAVMTDTPTEAQELLREGQAEAEGWLA